jgi:hypothetical protein
MPIKIKLLLNGEHQHFCENKLIHILETKSRYFLRRIGGIGSFLLSPQLNWFSGAKENSCRSSYYQTIESR